MTREHIARRLAAEFAGAEVGSPRARNALHYYRAGWLRVARFVEGEVRRARGRTVGYVAAMSQGKQQDIFQRYPKDAEWANARVVLVPRKRKGKR